MSDTTERVHKNWTKKNKKKTFIYVDNLHKSKFHPKNTIVTHVHWKHYFTLINQDIFYLSYK